MNGKIQEQVRAQKTIDEIVARTAVASKALGAKEEELSQINSKIAVADRQLEAKNRDIESAAGKLADLVKSIEDAERRIKALQAAEDALTERSPKLKAQIDATQQVLDDLIAEILAKNGYLDELNTTISGAEVEVSTLQGQKERLLLEISENTNLSDLQKKDLGEKMAELDRKIAYNEKLTTALEVDRGKLEIFVKRLQRYYDETNIHLYILDEFHIEPRK